MQLVYGNANFAIKQLFVIDNSECNKEHETITTNDKTHQQDKSQTYIGITKSPTLNGH